MSDLLVDTYYVMDGMTLPRQLRDEPRIDEPTKQGAMPLWRALPGHGDAIELWAIRASAEEGDYVYRLRVRTSIPALSPWDRQRIDATGYAGDYWPLDRGFAVEVQP